MQFFPVLLKYSDINTIDSSFRFAASIAMFGNLLKQPHTPLDYDWDDVKNIALSAYNMNDGLEAQFIELIDKAKKIYGEKKRRRTKK